MSDEWYSDAALAKQAALAASDRPPKWSDLLGLLEPRTQPTEVERCAHCRADARDDAGGEIHDDRRYCGLCVDRERHLPD